jgi:hypothetical protein
MSQGGRYQIQLTAQFFVAAELSRRGYVVSLKSVSATFSELDVQSPAGKGFTVRVQGQSTRTFFPIQKRSPHPTVFYILVHLPPKLAAPRFFVFTSDELMRRREEYRKLTESRGSYHEELGGISWTTALQNEEEWDVLPE